MQMQHQIQMQQQQQPHQPHTPQGPGYQTPLHPSPQQQQQQQQLQQRAQQEDKLASKARELINGPLRERWNTTIREAAQKLYASGIQDSGNVSNANLAAQGAKFESNLEDFYATLDQVQLLFLSIFLGWKSYQTSL